MRAAAGIGLLRRGREDQSGGKVYADEAAARGGELSGNGSASLLFSAMGVGDGEASADDGDDRQQGQEHQSTSRQAKVFALLVQVLGFQVLLRGSVHRRRKLGDGAPEPRVVQRQMVVVARPVQIEMTRHLSESTA